MSKTTKHVLVGGDSSDRYAYVFCRRHLDVRLLETALQDDERVDPADDDVDCVDCEVTDARLHHTF